MAIDTREKRASAAGFLYAALPLPNVNVAGTDRPQVSWVYVGIAAQAPPPPVETRGVTATQLLDLVVRQRAEGVRWELLDSSLMKIGDLHPEFGSASVEVATDAAYIRALRNMTLLASEASQIDTFASRVKPWWVLETGDEYPLGVFMFQARDRPQRTWGGPTVCPLLVDQSWILDQGRRSSFSLAAGASLVAALRTLATEVGIVDLSGIEGSGITASTAIAWAPGTSRLKIMVELCGLLAFHPPYFNNSGKLICRSVPDLDTTTASRVYALGDASRVVMDTATESDDAWAAPNVFVVVNQSATGTPIVGTYTIPASAPNSVANRGFEVVRTISEPGVQDNAQAAALAKAAYVNSPGAYRWVDFDATPDPRHDIFDVVSFDGVNHWEKQWALALTPGGPHHHSLRRIFT